MSSSNPSPEDPAFTSLPNVLSPVSPKPLHYPLPQNVPVLENQIDQGFNQTSAHMVVPETLQQPQPTLSALHSPMTTDTTQVLPTNGASVPDDDSPPQKSEIGQDMASQAQDSQGDSQMKDASTAGASSEPVATFDTSDQDPVQASNETVPTPTPHPTSTPSNPGLSEPNAVLHFSAPTSAPSDPIAVLPSPAHASVFPPRHEDSQSIPPPAQTPTVTLDSHLAAVDNNVNHEQFQSSLQHLLANFSKPLPPTNEVAAETTQALPTHEFAVAPVQALDTATAPGTSPDAVATAAGGPPPGLPAKPPAQEQPSIHHHYDSSTDIRAYHPHSQHASPSTYKSPGAAYNASAQLPTYPPAPGQTGAPGINSLPPPPVASFQQPSRSPTSQANHQRDLESARQIKLAAGEVVEEEDRPWTPDTQRKYDVFLNEERKYVTEGKWEQFPMGSRLFVGNLGSDRVTKRDVFHVFHKYGELAQISIKQAYGFVQYLEPESCAQAIQVEQGKVIRGKKTHLEVSKPQKNRNTDTKGSRRSRSPDRAGRGGANTNTDRYMPSPQDRRDRNRKSGRGSGRDDFHRSPSPSYGRHRRNSRDRSRDRYDTRYRSRSRSPYSRNRYRSPTPRRTEDDELPLPRRRVDEVPDIQIIALDALDRDFITYVERAFSSRSLRVDVLFLSPRLSLDAVIKRQVLEGVHAVSKLTMDNQRTVKIPLQIFDRRNPSNVRFDEYAQIDLNVAIELVIRAKSLNHPPAPMPLQYGYAGLPNLSAASGTVLPPPPVPQLPPHLSHSLPVTRDQPNIGNLLTTLDSANLQKLLGAMQQPSPTTGGMSSELATLVSGGAAPGVPGGGFSSTFQPPQHQGGGAGAFGVGGVDPLAALRNNPALAGLLGSMQGAPVGSSTAQGFVPPPPPQQQQQQQLGGTGASVTGVNGGAGAGGQGSVSMSLNGGGGGHDMAEILARLGSYGQQQR